MKDYPNPHKNNAKYLILKGKVHYVGIPKPPLRDYSKSPILDYLNPPKNGLFLRPKLLRH